MSDEGSEIERLARLNRHALALAELVSLAARVEPPLLRRLRRTLLPHSDASAEADLWNSALVQGRSVASLVLWPTAAEGLRQRLAALPVQLAARAHAFIRDAHGHVPLLQLHEELLYLSLQRQQGGAAAAEASEGARKSLLSVAAALRDPERAVKVAAWAARTLPLLPDWIQASEEAALVSLAANTWLRAPRLDPGGHSTLPAELQWVLPSDLAQVPIALQRHGEVLYLGGPVRRGGQRIRVPATEPLLLQVEWAGGRRVMEVSPTAVQDVRVGRGEVSLRTAAGMCYVQRPVPSRVALVRAMAQLLGDHERLDAFTSEHFPDIFRLFSSGMNLTEKVSLLLQLAEEPKLGSLLQEALGSPLDLHDELLAGWGEAPAEPTDPPSLETLADLIRTLLSTSADLDRFCILYFPQVHRQFTSGMSQSQRIDLLLDRVPAEAIWSALHAEGLMSRPDQAPASPPPRPILRRLLDEWLQESGGEGLRSLLRALPESCSRDINPSWPRRRILNELFAHNLDARAWQGALAARPRLHEIDPAALRAEREEQARRILGRHLEQSVDRPLLRHLLMSLPVPRDELLDDLLMAFLLDHFPAVAQDVSRTMDTVAKVTVLFTQVKESSIFNELALDHPGHISRQLRSRLKPSGLRILFSWIQLADLDILSNRRWSHLSLSQDMYRLSLLDIPSPQVLLIAGNIAHPEQVDEYQRTRELLLQFAKTYLLSPEQIYLVPGTHDLERAPSDSPERSRSSGSSLEERLAGSRFFEQSRARMRRYLEFAAEFGPSRSLHGDVDDLHLTWRALIGPRPRLPIDLVGLNTALLSRRSDKPPLALLGKRTLQHAFAAPPESEGLQLVLSHHPPGWLSDSLAASLLGRDRQICVHAFPDEPESSYGTRRGGSLSLACGVLRSSETFVYQLAAVMEAEDGSQLLRVWRRVVLPRPADQSADFRDHFVDHPLRGPVRARNMQDEPIPGEETARPARSDRITSPTRASLRAFMGWVLPSDSELSAFVNDYFTEVYRRFTLGMVRDEKINLLFMLLSTEQILDSLYQHDPTRCEEHASLLRAA